MSPSRWTDCTIAEPKNHHYVTQLGASCPNSPKSSAVLSTTASDQAPAPFFLPFSPNPNSFTPSALLLRPVLCHQPDSVGPAFCFIWWAASCPPLLDDLLHMHLQPQEELLMCWGKMPLANWTLPCGSMTLFQALFSCIDWHHCLTWESVLCLCSTGAVGLERGNIPPIGWWKITCPLYDKDS